MTTLRGLPRLEWGLALLIACLGAAGLVLQQGLLARPLLAPMLGGMSQCWFVPSEAPVPPHLVQCAQPQGSAQTLIENTLKQLQPAVDPKGAWELGYTLQVPLLHLYKRDEQGQWVIDDVAVNRIARTVTHSARPLVLYLFSTHFGIGAPIEPVLAADPSNLAEGPDGPLPLDRYYDIPIYPWSVARTDNELTRKRVQAIKAVSAAICHLQPHPQSRPTLRGITLLGEVHQLFPHFETGMGFDGPYTVSDYSQPSKEGFKRFLQHRFGHIDTLNQHLGASFPAFDAVVPPSKNIRQDKLQHFFEHVDSFAAGQVPITGWVHAPNGLAASRLVEVFLNGRLLAQKKIDLSRQDVASVHPEFGTADVGWRHDLDVRSLPRGLHQLDIQLHDPKTGQRWLLGHRSLAVMGQSQSAVSPVPAQATAPHADPLPATYLSYIDHPHDQLAVFYNPLAALWQTYRQQQVQAYLAHFEQVLAQSCLAKIPRYVHQIFPFANPGWDSGKYAVDLSLQETTGLRTGVSLYGEPVYGQSYFDWLATHPKQRGYGVTEFHPLKAMDAHELRQTLEQHRLHGVQFLSFFLEARSKQGLFASEMNMFSLDPENHGVGSDTLYQSMQQVLQPQP